MDYLEIAGVAVGVIYLYLEYKASVWLWVASIAMPAIYLFVYYDAGLYADFGISVYYLLASVYGLICWLEHRIFRNKNREAEKTPRQDYSPGLGITRTPRRTYIALCIIFATLFVLIGYILERFTDSTVPWADSFTTALSIVAMWMLARKYVEQWIVWIIADVACAALYVYKDLWFTGALYAAYAVIAVFGYRKWLTIMRTDA